MKILAIDTASHTCSVAVLDDRQLLTEILLSRAQVHSRHLMEMIDNALKYSGITAPEIDGFAVSRGPGGFTGLRIGMSAAKGMAFALGKKIIGIPTLEALALPLRREARRICAMLDARRGDVYAASYRIEKERLIPEDEPMVMKPEALAARMTHPCTFVGDGADAYRTVIETICREGASFAEPAKNVIRAETIARIALDRFRENIHDDVAGLAPVYIRKSDAELNLGRKTA
jgi:tRNA threonylcarbamoyladenosine biosynthesis protein TsaB